ncbi:hypothetical protein NL676_008091 [Syzygium grande]|nr:hypothetical protein NL676_008091 [Syzygium grande]
MIEMKQSSYNASWRNYYIISTEHPYMLLNYGFFEDVWHILHENTGMNAVKAIVLDLRTPEGITISPDTFANKKMLRVLILHEVHISSQGPIHLPNELRWLEWLNAPELEFSSGSKKLMTLDVQKSHIRQLGDHFQNFRKLKSINFSQCMGQCARCVIIRGTPEEERS